MHRKVLTALCGAALAASASVAGYPGTAVAAQPDALQARFLQQEQAHQVLDTLPESLKNQLAGKWFDPTTGKLTVAVSDEASAQQARAAGAAAKLVDRDRATLDRLRSTVRDAAAGVPGISTYGVDQRNNEVLVTVDSTRKTAATSEFVAKVSAIDGVRVRESDRAPRQQAGELNTGDPWWPGSETYCSVGFAATDANGGKHMLTAGHCTNDANQAAYGASGQQNRLGTANVGGNRSVNAREGDMGVVAVTEPGWTLSAAVNTWGQAPVTVTGSAEAIVGDTVCHSGNTSKWKCGEVTYVNETVDYGGGLVIEGLTFTTACSQGGDSGGGWLRGDKAVGLHDGGPRQCVSNPSKEDQSIFQPVNEALTKWGLKLVTGTGGGDPDPDPGGERTFSNGTDYPIRDYQTSTSQIRSTATGQAASPVRLTVTASHTCLEDLNVSLTAPSGQRYTMQRSGGFSCTPFPGTKTYSVPVIGQNATGTWTLRIADNGPGDTGVLDSWSITV